MDRHSSVLNEIVKAKENIKRKYELLKSNDADVKSLVTLTFEPIIEPLNRLSYNSREPPTVIENNGKRYNQNVDKWFQHEDIDKTYGPKKLPNNVISLGDKEVLFTDNNINIGEKSYALTPGLISLLFLKRPVVYSEADLDSYK